MYLHLRHGSQKNAKIAPPLLAARHTFTGILPAHILILDTLIHGTFVFVKGISPLERSSYRPLVARSYCKSRQQWRGFPYGLVLFGKTALAGNWMAFISHGSVAYPHSSCRIWGSFFRWHDTSRISVAAHYRPCSAWKQKRDYMHFVIYRFAGKSSMGIAVRACPVLTKYSIYYRAGGCQGGCAICCENFLNLQMWHNILN